MNYLSEFGEELRDYMEPTGSENSPWAKHCLDLKFYNPEIQSGN